MNFECSTTFEVNKTFRKKVTLPPLSKWRVTEEDSLMSGSVQSIIRSKGLIFQHTSPNQRRYTNITKQGFMIVYDGEDKGYAIDLTTAVSVKTKTVFSRGIKRTRQSRVDVKMTFGTFCMLLWEADAKGWLDAINTAILRKKHIRRSLSQSKPSISHHDQIKNDATDNEKTLVDEGEPISSLKTPNAELSSRTVVDESQLISEFPMSSAIEFPLKEDSTRSKSPLTVIEVKPKHRSQVELPPTPFVEASPVHSPSVPSILSSETVVELTNEVVRHGAESVATLCQKLESKSYSWRKTRKERRPNMISHHLVPSKEPKTPRLVVHKSASAPALFPLQVLLPKPKSTKMTLATISYDGCFDSIRA